MQRTNFEYGSHYFIIFFKRNLKVVVCVCVCVWGGGGCTQHKPLPYAGYTPQDNRADFGPISPLPTILGNVSIILVDIKIILSDFPVV